MRVEVRCCCSAKLLGSVEAPDGLAKGQAVFARSDEWDGSCRASWRLEAASMSRGRMVPDPSTLRGYKFSETEVWLALKKPHEMPMADLEAMPGFRSADQMLRGAMCGPAEFYAAAPRSPDATRAVYGKSFVAETLAEGAP